MTIQLEVEFLPMVINCHPSWWISEKTNIHINAVLLAQIHFRYRLCPTSVRRFLAIARDITLLLKTVPHHRHFLFSVFLASFCAFSFLVTGLELRSLQLAYLKVFARLYFFVVEFWTSLGCWRKCFSMSWVYESMVTLYLGLLVFSLFISAFMSGERLLILPHYCRWRSLFSL